MPIPITVPRLGWSSEEGIFAGWLKQPGEKVSSGEPLFALESDKVTMEVESLDQGTLQVAAGGPETGGVVTVGQLLGYLLADGEQAEPTPAAAPAPVRIPASPRARAKAKSLGIDIATLRPAPGSKRIVEADVLRAAPPVAPSQPATVTRKTSPRARKLIASRLEESFRVPHFYVHAEVDATSLARMRDELVPIVEQRHRVRLTYNDLLVKAIALTLRAMPQVNCYWHEGEIAAWNQVNVGLAVQAGDNLLVPVIRDADRKPLPEIARTRNELVERCNRSDVKPADFEDGSVTLSNLGPYGVDRFQAILNPPQSAIVAVGRLAKRPFVDGDAVVARFTLPLSISVDHRVIDGVAAAKFLSGIVTLLQSPLQLLLPQDW